MTKPMRKIVNPEPIHPPLGYSHVVLPLGKQLAFIAGQVAWDKDFKLVGGDDLFQQTRQALINLRSALEAIGAGWENVVKTTIYTTRPTEYETIGRAMAEIVGAVAPPASVIAGVSGLAMAEFLIEIEAVVTLD